MSRRMPTIATVPQFQARVTEDLRDRLAASAERAGVPWDGVCAVADRLLLRTCRAAAAELLNMMADWTPERWAQQDEVRQAQPHPLTDS